MSKAQTLGLVLLYCLSLWMAYTLGFERGQIDFATTHHWMPLPGPEAGVMN